jgi:hypothetical protein
MLNYSYTQATNPVPVESGAKIIVESVLKWNSDNPNDKSLHTFLIIEGEFQGKTEKWTFPWNIESQGALEEAQRGIFAHINSRGMLRNGLRRDAFTDVHPWLRIGWIDEKGDFFGYLTVSLEGKEMTSHFKNFEGLANVRHALKQAMNP